MKSWVSCVMKWIVQPKLSYTSSDPSITEDEDSDFERSTEIQKSSKGQQTTPAINKNQCKYQSQKDFETCEGLLNIERHKVATLNLRLASIKKDSAWNELHLKRRLSKNKHTISALKTELDEEKENVSKLEEYVKQMQAQDELLQKAQEQQKKIASSLAEISEVNNQVQMQLSSKDKLLQEAEQQRKKLELSLSNEVAKNVDLTNQLQMQLRLKHEQLQEAENRRKKLVAKNVELTNQLLWANKQFEAKYKTSIVAVNQPIAATNSSANTSNNSDVVLPIPTSANSTQLQTVTGDENTIPNNLKENDLMRELENRNKMYPPQLRSSYLSFGYDQVIGSTENRKRKPLGDLQVNVPTNKSTIGTVSDAPGKKKRKLSESVHKYRT